MLPPLSFIIGGAASGKSVFAESLILNSRLSPVYVATSRIWDDETKKRVDVHQARRDERWRTIDAPFDLAPALQDITADHCVLIDCATMWLTNHLLEEHDLADAEHSLRTALAACAAPCLIVSNEVGQGIVPDNALSRRFREAQGRLNIALAAQASLVVQVVAGLPNVLKGTLP
ncbi:bifunctional adenosylcobinamide kinase/adenosylcobinamide-phosphate guanylyltransferase [Ascidiaceihabitans sp.]|uniref:bifunctional adenosylcobinamide kinase/adenosylcobinamide-phosphate guanylyltransferase n=1 Tax=Ascidiaceihabitans sp. TaxID=1872644 RepID=UPI00329A735A